MAKRTIRVGEHELMGEEIPFLSEREAWNEYALEDGTKLKLKTVLADVVRIDGQYAPNGDPMYMVNASTIVSTIAPETLKRKG
jgi:hypothetical protein